MKEFQLSGRLHLHLYVGLPTAISGFDFEGLHSALCSAHRLARDYGRYEGGRRLPAISATDGGDFAMWLRTAWSEIVGTQGVVQQHHARGADVAVMFWTEEAAATADRTLVAQYLAREAAKFRQKQPPNGFTRVGRYCGRWGARSASTLSTTSSPFDPTVAREVERRLNRWVT